MYSFVEFIVYSVVCTAVALLRMMYTPGGVCYSELSDAPFVVCLLFIFILIISISIEFEGAHCSVYVGACVVVVMNHLPTKYWGLRG